MIVGQTNPTHLAQMTMPYWFRAILELHFAVLYGQSASNQETRGDS